MILVRTVESKTRSEPTVIYFAASTHSAGGTGDSNVLQLREGSKVRQAITGDSVPLFMQVP